MRPPLALAVLCGLLAGCDGESDRYPSTLRYPLRSDPIVLRTPPSIPASATAPGRLDEVIAAFPGRGGELLWPGDLPPGEPAALAEALTATFGTPESPILPGVEAPLLAEGSRLYRRQCAQCHGLTGDGRGPAGPWHTPHPRDFRAGVFKAASGHPGGRPSAEVVRRTLRAGVPGTAMQPFDLLPDADIDALTVYVLFLGIRGETELRWLRAALDPDAGAAPADAVRAAWDGATSPRPEGAGPADADAIRRGHDLFLGAGGCASCHGDYGRAAQFRYDGWGAVNRVPDLTRGEQRWGKSLADHARKIRHGIPGSGMPGSLLPDADIRDLAAFVAALPKPPRLPPDVRLRVYPLPSPAPDGDRPAP